MPSQLYDRGYYVSETSEQAALSYLIAFNAFSWLRADRTVQSGGGVDSFLECALANPAIQNAPYLQPTHKYNLASAAKVAIAAEPLLSNQLAAFFTATQYYDSTLTPAQWSYSNNGSPFTWYGIFVPTDLTNVCMFCGTEIGTAGTLVSLNNGSPSSLRLRVRKTAGVTVLEIDSAPPNSLVINTPYLGRVSYQEGAAPFEGYSSANAIAAMANSAVAPLNENPNATMRVGQRPTVAGTECFSRVAEMIWANQVSASLDSIVQRYAYLRYGVSVFR